MYIVLPDDTDDKRAMDEPVNAILVHVKVRDDIRRAYLDRRQKNDSIRISNIVLW